MAAKRITLPGTNLNVSRVCLGCWQFNGGKDTVNWDAQTPEVSVVTAIHRFPGVIRGAAMGEVREKSTRSCILISVA